MEGAVAAAAAEGEAEEGALAQPAPAAEAFPVSVGEKNCHPLRTIELMLQDGNVSVHDILRAERINFETN